MLLKYDKMMIKYNTIVLNFKHGIIMYCGQGLRLQKTHTIHLGLFTQEVWEPLQCSTGELASGTVC